MKDDERLIRALPHIRLQEANDGKRDALDAVWDAYQGLCQTWLAALVYESQLSARWQRVAWLRAGGPTGARQRKPSWKEPTLPELKSVCIQANVNGVKRLDEAPDGVQLDASVHSQFDDWLQMATLIKRQPVDLPVRAL